MRFITFVIFSALLLASNFFTTTDASGKITKKKIKHTNNASLNQDAKEYSYQAFYADLQKEKIAALQAQMDRFKNGEKINNTQPSANCSASTTAITQNAKQFQGGKYVWGGTHPDGFDCSGYTQYIYAKHGIKLPRTALAQSKVGTQISRANLRAGDLLFFLTDKSRGIPVTHVGIYLGNDEFIHAAGKDKGIIISPLNNGSYAKCFVEAKRVLPS